MIKYMVTIQSIIFSEKMELFYDNIIWRINTWIETKEN